MRLRRLMGRAVRRLAEAARQFDEDDEAAFEPLTDVSGYVADRPDGPRLLVVLCGARGGVLRLELAPSQAYHLSNRLLGAAAELEKRAGGVRDGGAAFVPEGAGT